MPKHYRHSSASITPAIIMAYHFKYPKVIHARCQTWLIAWKVTAINILSAHLPGNWADSFTADNCQINKES